MARLYYERGPVRIWHGDCLEWLPTLEAGSVGSIITDPVWPNCPDGLLAGSDNPEKLFTMCCHAIPLGVRQIVAVLRNDCDPRFLRAIPSKFPFQQTVWLQYVMPGYLGRVLGGNECGYVFGLPVKRQEGRKVIPSISPKAQPSDRPPNGHPCSRAQIHFDWLVNWFSDEWETVCDPFLGSGTTAVACIRTGRQFIGCELEEKYCEIAAKRCDRELDQGRLFTPESDPQPTQKTLID